MGKPPWDDGLVARLRVGWMQGKTSVELGRELKKTPNAVVGKAARIGLPGRPSPLGRRKHPLPLVEVIRLPVPPPQPPIALGLVRKCQWPIGAPRTPGFRLCEAPNVVPGRSYCLDHCQIAFRKVEQRAA